MDIDAAVIQDSVAETWTGVFGLTPHARTEVIPHGQRREFLSAIIQITGDWTGSLIIDYDPKLARHMAELFSDRPGAPVRFPEMRDVLGETVNIVAGHLKGVLPAGCRLSLPSVVIGLDYRLLVGGAEMTGRYAFDCEAGPFQLTIYQVRGGSSGRAHGAGGSR